MISRQIDACLVKMQADRNLSRGKALNLVIAEGLISFGYLSRPKTPEQLTAEATDREREWVKTHVNEMSPKAKEYWKQRYPEAFS
jgi:hypothetical protein